MLGRSRAALPSIHGRTWHRIRTLRWTSAGQQRYGSYVERLLRAGVLCAGLRGECPGTARALPDQARGRQACPRSLLSKKLRNGSTPASNLMHCIIKSPDVNVSPFSATPTCPPERYPGLLANANLLSPAVAQSDEHLVQRPRACGDPRLRISSVTFIGLPDLLAALAGAPAPQRTETLGSRSGPGSGSGRVARALLAVFQRGRQIWSGAALGVRTWACHVLSW